MRPWRPGCCGRQVSRCEGVRPGAEVLQKTHQTRLAGIVFAEAQRGRFRDGDAHHGGPLHALAVAGEDDGEDNVMTSLKRPQDRRSAGGVV